MELFKNVELIARKPHVLELIVYPDSRLNKESQLVTSSSISTRDLSELLSDMESTLDYYKALGLSAVQVGVPLRIILVKDASSGTIKMINPVLKYKSEATTYLDEGCLSVPGVFTRVARAQIIKVDYLDEKMALHQAYFEDMTAKAVLHEIDHLDGVLFFDKMNSVQRQSALNKFKKIRKKL